MPRTPFCDLLGITHPIVQAAIWPATSPELVAAVANAGALGSLGAVFASADHLARQIARVRELTDRPFAVNHVVPQLNEDAFAVTLAARPAAISFALGDPGELAVRARAAGAKVLCQIHTVEQARMMTTRAVDVLIAQGGEAGGQGLADGPSTLALVPQVVDAVAPLPVLAAGGIADGRGVAAALALGAQGVNLGTRFLATPEAAAPAPWKEAILAAASEDAIRFTVWRDIMPPPASVAYDAVPRLLRTPFVDAWRERPDAAREHAEELRGEIFDALQAGRAHELVPFAGQSVGLVREVLPAGALVRRLVAEADAVIARLGGLPPG